MLCVFTYVVPLLLLEQRILGPRTSFPAGREHTHWSWIVIDKAWLLHGLAMGLQLLHSNSRALNLDRRRRRYLKPDSCCRVLSVENAR